LVCRDQVLTEFNKLLHRGCFKSNVDHIFVGSLWPWYKST
jgi:hypothetical protein